jgi:lipopolysaccharide biosynthesis glycosyltransferase
VAVQRALVTVTNEKYFQGTQVLLFSFLKYNPNFNGDLIVIHNNLNPNFKKALSDKFPVKFKQVNLELIEVLNLLIRDLPQFGKKQERFWSLEFFRLNDYSQLLFLDSDIVCKGSIEELWNLKDEFSACPDLSYFNNKFRNKKSFELSSSLDKISDFERTFNAGVMLYNPTKNRETNYNELLNLLSSETYSNITSGHTDQYLLNHYFHARVNWLSAKYNYIVREETSIDSKEGISSNEAVFLHYIRNPKPWNFRRILTKRIKGEGREVSFKDWRLSYIEMSKKHKVSISLKSRAFIFLCDVFD